MYNAPQELHLSGITSCGMIAKEAETVADEVRSPKAIIHRPLDSNRAGISVVREKWMKVTSFPGS